VGIFGSASLGDETLEVTAPLCLRGEYRRNKASTPGTKGTQSYTLGCEDSALSRRQVFQAHPLGIVDSPFRPFKH